MVCPCPPGQPGSGEGTKGHDDKVPRPQPLLGELSCSRGTGGAPGATPGQSNDAGQHEIDATPLFHPGFDIGFILLVDLVGMGHIGVDVVQTNMAVKLCWAVAVAARTPGLT